MASFRKIGGMYKNRIDLNKAKAKVKENVQEMHISQIESEQTVYYPLMSDNDSFRFRYFEDPGITYSYNQIIQDFALNVDNLSVTNMYNIDSLTFADGTVLTTAPILTQAEKIETNRETAIYNKLYNFIQGSIHVTLPIFGIYLVTFYILLEEDTDDTKDKNKQLDVYFNSNISPSDLNPDMTYSFCKTSLSCTGTFTVQYLEKNENTCNQNQTLFPSMRLEISNERKNNPLVKKESNITITRIA